MSLNLYNPANKRKDSLIEEFVIRKKEFATISKDLKTFEGKYPPQHYLIIGQRGAGKTTLIQRLIYYIEDDKNLFEHFLPVTLDEEQYGISELANLWERISEILEDYYSIGDVYSEVTRDIAKKNYEEKAFNALLSRLNKEDKHIVLFIDNFGDILDKFNEKEIKRLREILMTCPRIRLIAATPVLLDQVLDYKSPLFEFFTTVHLKGLDNEEIKTLLLKLSELNGSENKIKAILKNQFDRIEILRQFTGGVTRTVVLLYNIFMDSTNGNAISDLQSTLDALTPLYKHKMDDLKKHQQKILDVVAKSWDAVSVKEISARTRIESKIISAQLRQLEKNQIIEKISTSKKNHLYQIKERFFNIWYLMRYGRRNDRNRVIWLVRFLESWYNKEELEFRVESYVSALEAGKFEIDSVEILGEAYLSCHHVSLSLKSELIKRTAIQFPKSNLDARKTVYVELYNKAVDSLEKNNFNEAISFLKQIPLRDKEDDVRVFLVELYQATEDYDNCLEEGLALVDQGNNDSTILYAIGRSYYFLQNYKDAIKYLKSATKEGAVRAFVDLGNIYSTTGQFSKAEKFYLEGLKYDDSKGGAAHFLAHLYERKGDFQKSEKYHLLALELGEKRVNLCLASLYHDNGELEQAAKYYEEAVKTEEDSLIGYGILKIEIGEEMEGRALLTKAAKSNDNEIIFELARAYDFALNEPKNAIKYYKKLRKEYIDIAEHRIAHMYERLSDFHNAEKYFLRSFKKVEDYNVLFCLVSLYKDYNVKKKEALELINLAKQNIEFEPQDIVLYSEVLAWNGDLETSHKCIEDLISESTESELSNDRNMITTLTSYFVRLISLEYYQTASKLLEQKQLKEILKPVYFALMKYMMEDFPDEYLKMGSELKEIVEDIVSEIENLKK